MTSEEAIVQAQGIAKAYSTAGGAVTVLDGVDLTLRAGESLAITGESGSGKSTLLHLIAGLDAADAGITSMPESAAMLTCLRSCAVRRSSVGERSTAASVRTQGIGSGVASVVTAPCSCGMAKRCGAAETMVAAV